MGQKECESDPSLDQIGLHVSNMCHVVLLDKTFNLEIQTKIAKDKVFKICHLGRDHEDSRGNEVLEEVRLVEIHMGFVSNSPYDGKEVNSKA
ncbi:hypothetical protein VNO78_17993 [Psophocarpus tetragonolobus]|uniref:Uncharacterized protein n=1 Tax=Psophocarpus tetragonolobus TaxID=3891 RepID=A0AAN9SNL6_PSOTE